LSPVLGQEDEKDKPSGAKTNVTASTTISN
jgi:hypothetical protein